MAETEQPKRLFDFIDYQKSVCPQEVCVASKENGKWVELSTDDTILQSNKLSKGLLNLGIKPGDKVAMISNNRTEWVLSDLAILQIGAINVPIYPTITEEDYAYILNDAQVKLVFVSDSELLEKVNNIKSSVSTLEGIYTYDRIEGAKHWSELLDNNFDENEIASLRSNIKADDLATLIYTSGTTGKPKGVMLSHNNIVSNVLDSKERLPVDSEAIALSFLPLCHVYERMIIYLYTYTGVSFYFAESMETIGDNLKEIKPHVFTAVPRLLEKIYDKIVAKGKELTGIKKMLFFWALELGLQYDVKGKGFFYHLQLKLANKLIFSKWREALGGNTRVVASGSAALQPRLARIFLSAQIPIMEGYGLTETSPVVSVNCADNDGIRIGTVGRPLNNVEVKIAEDGEILVKGPNVMLGYYNKEEATNEVLKDGWFHTGDIGRIEEGNFLRITDRKKEIFKTSGGKYVAPQPMENKFKESLFVEQIMVIGEMQKHPAALVQPSFEHLMEWCKRKDIPYTTNTEMIENEQVIKRIGKEIHGFNSQFAKYEQIKKFKLTPEAWSIDGGELTPTLKLRRKEIRKKYESLYNEIYATEDDL